MVNSHFDFAFLFTARRSDHFLESPLELSGNREASTIPARSRIRRSETSPPVISLEGISHFVCSITLFVWFQHGARSTDPVEESNGNMAAGVDHGGSTLSAERLAPALSYPCLAASTPTTAASCTHSNGSGNRSDGSSSSAGAHSGVLSSGASGVFNASSSTAPTWTTVSGLAASVSSSLASFDPNGGAGPSNPGAVSAPASSSSPLNGSCNASIDEPLILATGTPPSPILGQRPVRSRSPANYSPTGRQAPDGAGSSTTQTSSREASLEKTSSVGPAAGPSGGLLSAGNAAAEVSLDQISVEGAESGSAASMRSFEQQSRISGQEVSNGAKVLGARKSIVLLITSPASFCARPTPAEHRQAKVGVVSDAQPDVPVTLRGLQTHIQGSAVGREAHCRLFVRPPARYSPPRAHLRHTELPVLLCKHLPVGDPGTLFASTTQRAAECPTSEIVSHRFRFCFQVQLRWKDVSALTKEKTALVIPNAIQICTDTEKHFFCSFGARDKTYVVLFRTWQQALLDQVTASASSVIVRFLDSPRFGVFTRSR